MDYKAILNLMKEMNHTDLTKLEIEEEGTRICMEKASNVVTLAQTAIPQVQAPTVMLPGNVPAMLPAQQAAMPIQTEASNAPAANAAAEKQSEEANCKKLVSPMVGTFYSSPSPDKSAFVKVGDKVKKGQPICIIEAMKLMNEIESELDGEIVKILVNNEEMVEFGQPLFLVK
jgi:acetyl-CoA carboxylase biotin carboxyl carrier protein